MNEKPGKELNCTVSFLMKRAWKANCLFFFPGGNETTGFLRFVSGCVSISPPRVGAPQEILARISPDHI